MVISNVKLPCVSNGRGSVPLCTVSSGTCPAPITLSKSIMSSPHTRLQRRWTFSKVHLFYLTRPLSTRNNKVRTKYIICYLSGIYRPSLPPSLSLSLPHNIYSCIAIIVITNSPPLYLSYPPFPQNSSEGNPTKTPSTPC